MFFDTFRTQKLFLSLEFFALNNNSINNYFISFNFYGKILNYQGLIENTKSADSSRCGSPLAAHSE